MTHELQNLIPPHRLRFEGYRFWFVDRIAWLNGVSLGIHLDLNRGRVDLHLANLIISIGRVPIYKTEWGVMAVSGSFHDQFSQQPRPYIRPRR